MIYQLKVSLKNTDLPIWRLIEVDSNISFHELHNLIQIAFEWEDSHLHIFSIQQSNQKNISTQRVRIGPITEDDVFSLEHADEEEVMINEWMIKQQDHCLYTYDFGENWEHHIVLEKIVQPLENISYPRCIQAIGMSPEEDGVDLFIHKYDNIDSYSLCEQINEEFQTYMSFSKPDEEAHPEQWRELFSKADELKQLKPWLWLEDNQIFAIKHPVLDEVIYCSILGASQQEFGMAAYIGEKGLYSLQQTMMGCSMKQMIYNQASILISFSNRDELEKEDYALIKSLELKYRGKKQWPMFRSFVPGYFPWFLNKQEVELLIYLLPLVLQVCKKAKDLPELLPSYNGKSIVFFEPNQQQIEMIDIQPMSNLSMPESSYNELELLRIRKDYPKVHLPIEFDYFYLDEPVQDLPKARPFYPIMFLSVDTYNQLIVHQDIVHPSELKELTANIIHMLHHLQAIPSEIIIHRKELYQYLQPIMNKLNIKLQLVEQLSVIPELKKEIFSLIGM